MRQYVKVFTAFGVGLASHTNIQRTAKSSHGRRHCAGARRLDDPCAGREAFSKPPARSLTGRPPE